MPSAFDESSDPIFIIDLKSLAVIDANAAAYLVLGYSKEEIRTKTLRHLCDEAGAQLIVGRCLSQQEQKHGSPFSPGVMGLLKKDRSKEELQVVCHLARHGEQRILYLQGRKPKRPAV